MNKLNKKDLKILEELSKNPKESISKIAKKVLLSQQVSDYRINNLIKKGIITGFHTIINPLIIGYRLFRLNIYLNKITDNLKQNIFKFIKNKKAVAWAGFVNGSWDLIIDFYVKSSNEAELFGKEIMENFEEIKRFEINELTIIVEKPSSNFSQKNFLKFSKDKEILIDELDDKILKIISQNAREKLIDLYEKLKVSIPTIKERIKKLENKKIIVGYRIFLDSRKFDKESYKLIFAVQEFDSDKIIKFGETHKNVIFILKYFGKNQFDFEIEIKDKKELQNLIVELRNNFDIENLQIISLLEDLELNHYPF